jgi:antitoxin component of RelBE/YafQ-DinJ toxin-antitoxin module
LYVLEWRLTMNAKLTLKLDSDVIERAKAYAERRGVSLSRLVESYFAELTHRELQEEPATGVVAELEGLLAGVKIEDEKDEYVDYLMRKYA